MTQKRRKHSDEFKFKVALEAAKGVQTINEIASAFNLHPNQVSSWKKRLMTSGPSVFSRAEGGQQAQAEQEAALYEQIGRLKMELEWLKKSLLE